jgi:hypothetical protein
MPLHYCAKFDALPRERITGIHSPIKLLQGLQKDKKFQCIPSHCGVMGYGMADFLSEEGTAINQTFARTLSFHSAKLKIKRSIQADLSRYYTTPSQHKHWNKTVQNRYTIPHSPRGDTVATF